MTPLRVFDTRDGTGGRKGALEPGESWTFTFKDRFGIPGDAVAVAVNLTSVERHRAHVRHGVAVGRRPPVHRRTSTRCPAWRCRTSSSAGSASAARSTSTTTRVACDLVADLVGFFKPSSGTRLQPLTPARLLDTRDGTGAAGPGPIGAGSTIDLVVADRGGTSADCTAVALNITVTEPTAGSYLTVWPAGQPRPLASSLNMVAGQTVPNLVISQVGRDGKVSIFNYGGSAHVVVDVLGCVQRERAGPVRLDLAGARARHPRRDRVAAGARRARRPRCCSSPGASASPPPVCPRCCSTSRWSQPTATRT